MATRPYIDLPFGPYAPDFGGMPNELGAYLTDSLNIRSTPNGYRPMPTFSDVASATAVTGSTGTLSFMKYATGTTSGYPAGIHNFFVVNGSGSLYRHQAEGVGAWSDVTPAGTAPKPSGTMFQFGQYAIFAGGNRTIYHDLAAGGAPVFVTLTGAPVAWLGARIRDHAVLGVLSSGAFDIQWCAIGAPTSWPTPGTSAALAAEAGTQTLNTEFGILRAMVGGEKSGLLFQEQAVTRQTYAGGSNVFEFDTFERKVGLGVNRSGFPVYAERLWWWATDKGIFATDGYSVNRVSLGKADEALFLNTISHPWASSIGSNFSGGYDPARRLIMWGPVTYTGATQYLLTLSLQDFSIGIQSGTTFQSFCNGIGGASSYNPEYIYNLDGSTMKLASLRGAAGSIALQTGYIELDPGYKTQITGAHLLGAGVPGSLALAYKSTSSLASVDVVQTGFTTMTAAPRGMKSTGRSTEQFHAFRVTGTGTEAQLIKGIRVYFERGEPAT